MTNQISKQSKTVASFLNMPQTSKFLESTLAEKKTEFVSNLIALADGDANIAKCDPGDLMKCALNATALSLPLNKNLGYAYIIPYKGVPSFQIGYKGLVQLAIRTGEYKYLNATDIREEEIERNKVTGELKFNGENPDGKIVGYVAYLELKTGFSASLYMTEDEIEAHALRFSKMYQADKNYSSSKSKWSDPEARPAMAKKTVLKGLLGTYGLMTSELSKAFDSDNDHAEYESNSNRSADIEDAEVIQQEEPKEEPIQHKKVDLKNLQ